MTSAVAPDVARSAPRHKVPAWLLSVVVHLVGLLILGLALQAPPPRGLPDSSGRDVRLVLATTSDSGKTEYLDEGPEEAVESVESPAAEASETLPPALPAASQPPVGALPELQLPGAEAVTGVDTQGLVQSPELRVAGRRPAFPGEIDSAAVAAEAARLRGGGPSGPIAEVSLFGSAPAAGRSFIFVIDRSHSMGGEGLGVLAAAEKELVKALARLEPVHRFQIIAYNHKPAYFHDRGMVSATPENARKVSKFFGGLAAFGATRHDLALLAALREHPDVIFFLTDGGDPAPNPLAMNQIRQRAGGGTTIHCLQFGFGVLQERDGFMQRLAVETGGSFGYVQVGAP